MRYLFPLSPWNQQRQWEKAVWVYPAHLAMYATYLRNEGHEVIWDSENINPDFKYGTRVIINEGFYKGSCGKIINEYACGWKIYVDFRIQLDDGNIIPFIDSREVDLEPINIDGKDKIIKDDFQIDIPFEKLPFPDRKFTNAKNPRWQRYGNYRYHPATHMMVSNLCWYGKCTFCIDTYKLEHGEKRGVRSVDHVMEEIDDLIANGYKEVFDDSGTFPVGAWLEEFHRKMQSRKKKIHIGINMKPIKMDYKLLADSGVGFTLVGIESANQETVDRIKKGQKSEDIIPIVKAMNDAGLQVHLTSMFGYEWETHEDAMRTVKLVHYLLKKGYVKTAQASVYSPPRTQPDPNSKGHKYIPKIYEAYRSPQFWYRKITDIKQWEDFTYLLRGGRLVAEEYWRKFRQRNRKSTEKVQ